MGRLVRINPATEEKNSQAAVVATGAHGRLVRTGDVQRTSPAGNTVKLPSRETERADELDKRTTPSKSRQGQNRSFGERLAKAAGSGLVAEGANLANLGGVAADRRGGTEMSAVYRRQAETLDKQIAALEKSLKDPTMTAQDIRETNEALAIARSEREKYGKVIESGEKTALGLYDTADKGYSLAEKWGEESTAGTKGIEKGALKIVPAATQIGLQVAERAIAPGFDVAGRALSAAGANAADYRHKAGEQYDKEKAALRATVSALGVAAGGALSKGVNAAGLKLLRAAGKQNHILPNVLLGGANAVGYAAGETGASELSKAMTEEDYTPDWGAIGQTAMTAFAFGAITSAINAAAMTGRNKRYMNELNDTVKERYDYAKRIIEDPRATAGQKAAGAESVMNAADKMRGALDELQVVGAQKEVDAMREFLLSIYGEMMPYTGAGSAGAGTAGIAPVTPGGGIMTVRPGEGANPMQEAVPSAPITPRAAGAAAAAQNSVPAQPAAAQEGARDVGEGNLTPMPQERAESTQTPLQNAGETDTIGKGTFSLKEELENGRAREETRDSFLQRAADEGYGILEGDTIAFGYRPDKSVLGNETGAGQIQEELRALGVNCEITDGTVLWNLNGISGTREIRQAVTVDGKNILVNRNADMPAKQVAGHEAFHLWKRLAAREAFVEAVEDNLIYTSPEFQQYQSAISQAYLGEEADLSNAAQYNKLREELLAYIGGDIHEGTNDDFLRPMFRDYDAVKAAWAGLTGAQTAQADNTTTAGGMNHGGQEVQNYAGGAEPAEAGERAGLPDGNGRRDNGASTGEQIGSVGGGRPQRAADQSRTALERQNRARDLRLEKVSSAELGVRMGTDEKSVTVLPESEWDDELRDVARRIEWETGKKTTMVVGSIRIRTDRGARSVRGVWTRDGIIIRADNMRISAEQIADHEIFHEYADQNPGLIQAVERSIREKYGDQEFDRIVESYIRNLRGIIDIDENAAGYEVEQALLDVKNEILADAYADINAFGEKAGKYQENVRQTLRERGIVDTGRETAAATERRTGPPERYSVQRTQDIPYQEQIDAFYEGDLKTVGRSDDIYVTGADGSPDALGLGGKPFFMLKRNLQKITRKEGANKNYSAHGIGEDIIRDLPDMLRDPAMVIVGDDRISVIPGRAVETAREKAAPLLIGVNPNGSVDGRSAYEIKTMYGREGFADWLGLRATDSRIIAGNKNKATALLRNVGIKITEPVAYAADLTDAILSQSKGDVKTPTAGDEIRRQIMGEEAGGAAKSNAAQELSRGVTVSGSLADTTSAAFENSIPKDGKHVKYSAFNEEVARQLAGEERGKTMFSAEDEEDGMREFPNLDAYLSGERGYTAETEDFYRRADEELADRAAEREREEERTRWVREWKREAAQERAYAKAERDAKREDAGNLKPTNKTATPAAASKPTIAKNDLREAIEDMFSIPGGERREVGKIIDQCADSILKNGALTQDERERFLNRMYAAGVVQTEGLLRAAGEYIAPRRVYVDKNERALFGEDWNSFRTRASAAGITLLVRMPENGNATGVDALRAGLAEQLPTVFDPRETSARETLERMVQLAEEGKDENLSLGEYISEVAGKDFIREKQLYDELERKMDDALRTFAEKADLEIRLRDRASTKIAQERERFNQMRQTERAAQKERESAQKAKDRAENEERERKARERDLMRKADAQERRIEAARRRRENREMKELQQKTLKQLQWLSKNRNRAPETMKDAWDEVLGDIDIYATSAANEMHWSDKHQATWGDLAQMYKDAQKNDPNFLPSKELEHIVHRLDDEKIADMDIDALQNLYKAAVGLRTEFYNRNKVIADEEHALFSELYSDAKQELRAAGRQSEPTGAKGAFDKYANDWQLTPMNTLERMAGWNRDSKWFKMAKQLEKGEREKRRYEVKAKRQLSGWLAENAEWVKKADGQGDDAIWYEVEVPELLELGMGDKPIFGDTIKVYMTPAQKVHMYLESKSYENLRHMAGGRTFADKELYSKGKRMEAFAKGKTVKLAPETVKKLTEDLTPEERELARLLEGYYNKFASGEINRVSNILYGYDKAVSKNYAPIYTNSNYVKSEPGVYNATAEGVGNLKPRQHSKNPSYNIGAFDAFEKHVDQTARFVGMAIPVRNWNTLMGWRDGKDSMADVVTHEWGLDAKTFIEKLLTELQDGKQSEQGKADRLISKALSNYISSVFGFNPSIVLKQAASFPLAAAYLDPKDMPNIRKALKVDDELIETYTSELSYRLLGYATPETAMLKNHPGKLQEKGVLNFVFGGGAITAMDGATVKTLWSWAEKKVQREHPELEKGTEEQIKRGESPFYQKVVEEFEEATSRSQPMYDVMHRSNIMRDSSGITRTFTLFKTVPQQEYNMLRQAMGEAEYHKKNGSDAKTQKEAKKKVGRVVMSILAGNLMLGTITFLNSMAKNKGKRYRDENGELTPESVMKQFLQQFMYDSLGVAIFGDTASELIGSALTGDKWYGIETPGIEQLNEMLEECKDACRLIPKTLEESGNVLANGGSWAQYMKDNSSVYLSAIEEIAETVATYLGGLPAENVKWYFLGMMKWIAPGAETEIEDLFDRPDKQGLKELDGKALETRVKNLLNDRVGNAPDEAVRRIARLYESGYTDAAPSATPSYVTIDKVKHELDAGKTQKYENAWRKAIGGELSEMVRLPAFIRADEETQEKMLKKLYSYASDMAKAEVFKEYEMKKSTMEMSDLAKHGLSVAVQIVAAVSGENDPKGLSLPTP